MVDHPDTFHGLPVVAFESGKPLPTTDGPVAWRVSYGSFWGEDGDDPDEDDWEGFLAHFAEFLDRVPGDTVEALVVGLWGNADENDAPVAELCEAADRLPRLRALFLGDIIADECEISWIRHDDITPLLLAYPALEVLRVRGDAGLRLEPLRHTALKELAFESGGLPGDVVRAIGGCDLPALERLELWLGVAEYGGDATADDLAPILAGTRLPALRNLGLRNAEIADQIATAVAAAPVVARLSTLDLSLGILSDTGAEALLTGQPLTHLQHLDLHHHYLTDDMMARVRADLPGVDIDLSEAGGSGDDQPYVAVSE